MNINFSEGSRKDIADIYSYLGERNPSAADKTIARLFQSIAYLGTFPLMGRPGRLENTRELTVTGMPYIVIYEIQSPTDLTVQSVVHTARQWPPTPK
ncbi:type II toxin-antitoxin system RelE/ParE family toxin [Pseudaestuariivita rosea]|uniref:type II toxin-antitoxin system RelE/ParE family toxin n=1 Tax=Pseudaestuariivita rosea TaxID=2763263 RepID=UPI001ABB55EB|nr:type II toxin-antitoxin system RelE/ParE family toxin [Pseudaestuariivita rosea]